MYALLPKSLIAKLSFQPTPKKLLQASEILQTNNCLCNKLTCAANSLDPSFSGFAELSSFDENWESWEFALAENLEEASFGHVDHSCFSVVDSLGSLPSVFRNDVPKGVEIHSWVMESISLHMQMSHTLLANVPRMVHEDVDSVMVLSTSVTSATWMLSVLSNSTVPVRFSTS